MAVVLSPPEILTQTPNSPLHFNQVGNKTVSDQCRIDVQAIFSQGDMMKCAIRVGIHPKYIAYFKVEPNAPDSTEYDIYRYYGVVASGFTDTFNFRLIASLPQGMVFPPRIYIVVSVKNCDYSDYKKVKTIYWDI